jgi:MFS family permease
MLGAGGDAFVPLWMGRITAAFLVGAAAGGLLFGWLGDKVGRVRAMAWSILVYSLFSGACYFAREPWHLGALRFISALGMGGEWSLGVALVMETWPAKHRPLLAGAIGAASNCGLVLIGWIGYAFPITQGSWRWVMLVGAAPALLTYLIRLFVPESERWQEAATTATTDPLREIFRPPLRRHTLLGIALAAVVLIGTWGSVQWIPTWVDKLTDGGQPQAKAVVALLIAAGAIFGCFAGSLCGKFGRRPAFCMLSLASLAVCAALFHGVSHYGPGFQVLSFFVGALTASFYGWLPLYLPELFPTRVRATAQGVSFNAGRLLAAAGALGSGQLVAFYHGDYAKMGATITLVYLVGALVIWLAPETRGRPLPE